MGGQITHANRRMKMALKDIEENNLLLTSPFTIIDNEEWEKSVIEKEKHRDEIISETNYLRGVYTTWSMSGFHSTPKTKEQCSNRASQLHELSNQLIAARQQQYSY